MAGVCVGIVAECGGIAGYVAWKVASGAWSLGLWLSDGGRRLTNDTRMLAARRRGHHVPGQDHPVGRVPRARARRRAQKAGPLAVSIVPELVWLLKCAVAFPLSPFTALLPVCVSSNRTMTEGGHRG